MHKDYNQEWPNQAEDIHTNEWNREMSRVFRLDRETHGWLALGLDGVETGFPLTKAQQWAMKYLKPHLKVLDAGCGNGYFTTEMHRNGINAFGFDVAEDAIAFCKNHIGGALKDQFFQADLNRKLEAADDFDVVIALDLLPQVISPIHTLQELWIKLKPGGRLILSLPAKEARPTPYHLHAFNEERIRDLTKQIGVEQPGDAVFGLTEMEDQWMLTMIKESVGFRYGYVCGTLEEAQSCNELAQNEQFKSSGWMWVRHLHGRGLPPHNMHEASEYDVFHIHVAGVLLQQPRRAKEIIERVQSATKVVVSVDYSLELWNALSQYPDMIMDCFACADYLMSAEPYQAQHIADITGRPVHFIPNPTETEKIAELSRPVGERQNCLVIAHTDWQSVYHIPYWAMQGVDKMPPTVVLGCREQSYGAGAAHSWPYLYNRIAPWTSADEAVRGAAQALFAVDPYEYTVFGRQAAELAALGIPTVGYENVFMQQYCFPDLTYKKGDVNGLRHGLKMLTGDRNFLAATGEQAQERAKRYDAQHCVKWFKEMLEGSDEKCIRPTQAFAVSSS